MYPNIFYSICTKDVYDRTQACKVFGRWVPTQPLYQPNLWNIYESKKINNKLKHKFSLHSSHTVNQHKYIFNIYQIFQLQR